jgi:hypothetical protein
MKIVNPTTPLDHGCLLLTVLWPSAQNTHHLDQARDYRSSDSGDGYFCSIPKLIAMQRILHQSFAERDRRFTIFE